MGLAKALDAELSKSLEYFWDERPPASWMDKIDRTKEREENSRRIVSICNEVDRLYTEQLKKRVFTQDEIFDSSERLNVTNHHVASNPEVQTLSSDTKSHS